MRAGFARYDPGWVLRGSYVYQDEADVTAWRKAFKKNLKVAALLGTGSKPAACAGARRESES